MSMEILAGISMIGCVGAGVALRISVKTSASLRSYADELFLINSTLFDENEGLRAENATIAGELARWTDRDARGRFVKRERV